MEASSEVVEPRLEPTARRTRIAAPSLPRTPAALYERYRVAILIFFATRLLLVAVVIVDGWLHSRSFTREIGNWDGYWYQMMANRGYPSHVVHGQSTLGFFPLYSITMWALKPLVFGSAATAGLIIATIGGLVATMLVQELATEWWDQPAGRRAAILFCLFPGSVVFSMVYSEGLLIPLAAGCLLALQRKRWVLAGVLAGFDTAVNATALPLIVACAVSALLELRRNDWRWRDRDVRRCLAAPVLSVTGIAAFAIYLWRHTGSPTASLTAQRTGWHEKTDPLAVVHLVTRLAKEISFKHFDQPTINLNYPVGLVGVFVLVGGLVLMCHRYGRVPIEAFLYTLGVGYLMMTSEYVPPNPRLLITAFPVVVVFARYIDGRRFKWLAAVMGLALIELSALTYVGVTLRP
jgi:hypothetical protein